MTDAPDGKRDGYLGLKVTQSLLDGLDRIASEAGLSRSDVVRMTLENHLADTERRLVAKDAHECRQCPIHCKEAVG